MKANSNLKPSNSATSGKGMLVSLNSRSIQNAPERNETEEDCYSSVPDEICYSEAEVPNEYKQLNLPQANKIKQQQVVDQEREEVVYYMTTETILEEPKIINSKSRNQILTRGGGLGATLSSSSLLVSKSSRTHQGSALTDRPNSQVNNSKSSYQVLVSAKRRSRNRDHSNSVASSSMLASSEDNLQGKGSKDLKYSCFSGMSLRTLEKSVKRQKKIEQKQQQPFQKPRIPIERALLIKQRFQLRSKSGSPASASKHKAKRSTRNESISNQASTVKKIVGCQNDASTQIGQTLTHQSIQTEISPLIVQEKVGQRKTDQNREYDSPPVQYSPERYPVRSFSPAKVLFKEYQGNNIKTTPQKKGAAGVAGTEEQRRQPASTKLVIHSSKPQLSSRVVKNQQNSVLMFDAAALESSQAESSSRKSDAQIIKRQKSSVRNSHSDYIAFVKRPSVKQL